MICSHVSSQRTKKYEKNCGPARELFLFEAFGLRRKGLRGLVACIAVYACMQEPPADWCTNLAGRACAIPIPAPIKCEHGERNAEGWLFENPMRAIFWMPKIPVLINERGKPVVFADRGTVVLFHVCPACVVCERPVPRSEQHNHDCARLAALLAFDETRASGRIRQLRTPRSSPQLTTRAARR